MHDGGNKVVIAAALANGGIAVAKVVGFLMTGATSMLAEAVHSFADTGNQVLLLVGAARAKKNPTEEHPFGYGRERYFWAFVVALVIFALGSVYAIYEGVHKFMDPHPLESPMIAVGILVVALALEGWSFRTAIKEANPLRGDRDWWSFIKDTRQAELPVVLLEDLGALLGLAVALAGIGLAMATGDARFDALGSITIGVLLGIIAVVLALQMQSLLIGESAAPDVVRQIRDALTNADEVRRVIHLRTVHLGPDQLLVGAKLEFAGNPLASDLSKQIDEAEARVREQVPSAGLIYVEPDIFDDSRKDEGPAPGIDV